MTKFEENDRVRFSPEGVSALCTNKRVPPERCGTVTIVKRDCPTVLWDGLKWPSGPYHPLFLVKVIL